MPSKPKQPDYIPSSELQTVERYFKGLPIREARGDILVQPSRGDLAKSTKNSPTNCAYAVFLKRTYHCPKVYIFETSAYVQTKDERGNPLVEHYEIKDHAATYIKKFDNGEDVSPGGFVLHKPSTSHELEYKRNRSRKWYAENKEEARKRSRESYHKSAQAKRLAKIEPRELPVASVRTGTGCVRFIGTYDGRIQPR